MDCVVHGVTKSQTWLSNFHSFTHSQGELYQISNNNYNETFSPTNSSKEQLNGEQSSQNNFWSLAADIRRPEKQPIVFEGR